MWKGGHVLRWSALSRILTLKPVLFRSALLALLALFIAGCATNGDEVAGAEEELEPYPGSEEVSDPFESVNRGIFVFNRGFDRVVLKPMAVGYRVIVPVFLREWVHAALLNLRAPIILVNDLLQGKTERAGITTARFLINSTLGIAGIRDAAAEDFGLEQHNEDFGQTLAVWGTGSGPYLMLPILGPSNPRDASGLLVDVFFDPLTYILSADKEFLYARTGVLAADERERHIEDFDDLEATSIDFYATIRSLYHQQREDAIRDGVLPPAIPIPSISLKEFPGDLEASAAEPDDAVLETAAGPDRISIHLDAVDSDPAVADIKIDPAAAMGPVTESINVEY